MTSLRDRLRGNDFWEFDRWYFPAVLRRARDWAGATRKRRWLTGTALILFALFVFPALLGTAAVAAAGGSGSSGDSALSWMGVKDSSGVELSNYVFATNNGGVLHPITTGIALIISLEFAGWMVIVTIGIWLITYVLSFRWLDLFATPLRAVGRTLSGQFAVPIVLTTAATIGAFFVGWFVLRGLHAKAAMQIATMLGVAVLAPLFLSDPLADVLSSDGWLVQGRDLGISIAAGLNGDSNPQPGQLVTTMQGQLADNFARRPLQVWNFGHVVDLNTACRGAWSAAAGDEDRTKSAMQSCGDGAAKASADNPNAGQIGAGVLLLIAGTLLLAFAAVLAIKIVRSALDSVYHGLLTIFGFAAGGFIYGPTQTFLVRCVVHAFFAAARMAAEVVFLGVYCLFLGDLFEQAGGQVMSVFVIGAIVEIVAILQLRRLTASMEKGNDWVANRFALAIQNGGRAAAGGGGGGGGGAALGMGTLGAGRPMNGLAMLGAVSAIGSSPITEWMWGRTRNPLRPQSRKERRASLAQWGVWGTPGIGGPDGTYMQTMMNRQNWAAAARKGAHAHGGIDTARGAAAAIQSAVDRGAGQGDLYAALRGAGFMDENLVANALESWGIVDQNSENTTLTDKQLGRTVAALQRAQFTANRLANPQPGRRPGHVDEVVADMATLQAAAFGFRRANEGGVTLQAHELAYVQDYMAQPTKEKLLALKSVAEGTNLHGVQMNSLNQSEQRLRNANIDQVAADRMWTWIGNEHALSVMTSVDNLVANPADPQLIREARRAVSDAQATDYFVSGGFPSPWKNVATPANNPTPPQWARRMGPVAQRLR